MNSEVIKLNRKFHPRRNFRRLRPEVGLEEDSLMLAAILPERRATQKLRTRRTRSIGEHSQTGACGVTVDDWNLGTIRGR
jgi:hypothetical protein